MTTEQITIPRKTFDAMRDELEHIGKAIERQIDLIGERAKGEYLDKRPVVQALQSHARRANAALTAANAVGFAHPTAPAIKESLTVPAWERCQWWQCGLAKRCVNTEKCGAAPEQAVKDGV